MHILGIDAANTERATAADRNVFSQMAMHHTIFMRSTASARLDKCADDPISADYNARLRFGPLFAIGRPHRARLLCPALQCPAIQEEKTS
jgi:hypothetical protein